MGNIVNWGKLGLVTMMVSLLIIFALSAGIGLTTAMLVSAATGGAAAPIALIAMKAVLISGGFHVTSSLILGTLAMILAGWSMERKVLHAKIPTFFTKHKLATLAILHTLFYAILNIMAIPLDLGSTVWGISELIFLTILFPISVLYMMSMLRITFKTMELFKLGKRGDYGV